MKRRSHRRAGHAQTGPGCASLLLSIALLCAAITAPGVRAALKAADSFVALLVLWGGCFLLGSGVVALSIWIAGLFAGARRRR